MEYRVELVPQAKYELFEALDYYRNISENLMIRLNSVLNWSLAIEKDTILKTLTSDNNI